MNYFIVRSTDSPDKAYQFVIDRVNAHIQEGWEPVGSLVVITYGNFLHVAQALRKSS